MRQTQELPPHRYQADRLLYPMRRIEPRAQDKSSASRGTTHSRMKARWTEIIDEYGPQAVMPHAYLGHQGVLNGLTSGDAFFNRLGSSVAEKRLRVRLIDRLDHDCWSHRRLNIESMAYSKYIIVWGMNMTSTNLHAWPFVLEAQKKGAKVVVMDPIRTRTARQADSHIPIRPGTDGALAMGLIQEIITQELVDVGYVANYTIGYDELAQRAAQYPPERVAEITGVPAETIRTLAREYATTQPAAIRQGVAIERSRAAARRSAPSPACPRWSAPGGTLGWHG